ncbi:MAG: hypothetical protein SVU32_03490 [Candidatus Nanohaloarchaea archaeon]|nr:hypothetical protein [Candidatus Nanohaloarchaea archaeon]
MFDGSSEETVTLRVYPPAGHFPAEPLEKLPTLIASRQEDQVSRMYGWSCQETDAGLQISSDQDEVTLYMNTDENGERYLAIAGDQDLAQSVQRAIKVDPLLFGSEEV